MKVFNATVKFPAGKIFDTPYGKSQSAKLILEDGKEISVWCKPDSPCEVHKWKKGDKVQVIDDKGKFKAVETDRPFEDTEKEKKQIDEIIKQGACEMSQMGLSMIEPPPQRKREILKYIEFQKRMYHHIFNQVSDEMKDIGLKDDLLKDISTSIFIQTNKRFTL